MAVYPAEDYIQDLKQRDTALKDALYLDYGASPPLLHSCLTAFQDRTRSTLLANPHSRSPASEATTVAIDRVRTRLITELLGFQSPSQAAEWDVIFTSGATAACRLVAQHFSWDADTSYAYLGSAAHTSLAGIRAAALQAGAPVYPLSPEKLVRHAQTPNVKLFGYPSQCNATGRCFSLSLCKDIKRASPSNFVILDAAASLATSSLDLSSTPVEEQPDFITWSAYKSYSWPTGLGCLFIKKSSGHILRKKSYFGGGSLDAMTVYQPFTIRLPQEGPLHRGFEDGSLAYLDIVALDAVMDNFEKVFDGPLSTGKVARHARRLTLLAAQQMRQLHHSNGRPLCRIHDSVTSPSYALGHGTALAFTLLDADGTPLGHVETDKLAAVNDVHIRTGGLCNIGALSEAMGLSDADLLDGSKVCWDEQEFINGKPAGMARISFGALSTQDDVDRWIAFLKRFFVTRQETLKKETAHSDLPFELAELCLYPIKSCAAMSIPQGLRWQISPTGLAYDREWMIINQSTGSALSQKRYTKMACIGAQVDLTRGKLLITIPHCQTFELSLKPPEDAQELLNSRVCAEKVQTIRHSTDALDAALSKWIGISCTLHRSLASCSTRHSHLNGTSSDRIPIALSNESPFLVVNQSSVDRLSKLSGQLISASAFRSNFVVRQATLTASPAAFVEDDWETLRIGNQAFQVLSYCRRCQMINVDQKTGHKLTEPYNVLSQTRRNEKGHLCFGLHLLHRRDLSVAPYELTVGNPVLPSSGKGR